VRDVNPDVPGQLSAVIDRLLEKKPHRRPANAADVQQELARLLSDLQQGRLRTRPARRTRSAVRLAGGIAAVGVTVALIAWAANWLRQTDSKPSTTGANRGAVAVPAVDSTGAFASDSVPGLLSIGPSTEAEFDAATGQLDSDLDRQESLSQKNDRYLQDMQSPWHRDSRAVRGAIGQLEQYPYLDSAPQGVNQ
jgi:hypothetical protein